MSKSESTKERMKPYFRFIGYVLFGTASMAVSALAAYALTNLIFWPVWAERALFAAIAITLAPAVIATGRYIVQGAFNAAKEVKE